MKKNLILAYGIVCYAIFFGTFLYAIGFLGNFIVAKSIDSGEEGTTTQAIIINLILLALFAVPHSIMARPGFKKAWTKIVPEPMERSTYVFLSSLLLILLFWQWRPMTGDFWNVAGQPAASIFWFFFAVGWALVLVSTFLIDHFDLFGLRQVWVHWQGKEYEDKPFSNPSFYKYTRHPLNLGWLLAFWATPSMTMGHLLFAVVTTAYILVAIQLEERDLIKLFGEDYAQYKKTTPMIFPFPKQAPAQTAPATDVEDPPSDAEEPTPDVEDPPSDAEEPTPDAEEPTPDSEEPTPDAEKA